MKLIIISGLSGSGKSVALHTLEDEEYYCVDNLPPTLLPDFVRELERSAPELHKLTAVGVDARSTPQDLQQFPDHMQQLRDHCVEVELIFLEAETSVLIKRFSETRRRHPLSHDSLPLMEAIEKERQLLSVVKERADLVIDTTTLNVHDLRKLMIQRVHSPRSPETLSLLFQSFGFKHGVPGDSDFVFDARCIPNPHWVPELRPLTGRDPAVQQFLHDEPMAGEMLQSIGDFLDRWLPHFEAEKRRYITVSVGCNGGQHRSVYLCEQLAALFADKHGGVTLRHRELNQA